MARAHDGTWIADGPEGEARRRAYARKFGLTIDVATGKPFDPPLDAEPPTLVTDSPPVTDNVTDTDKCGTKCDICGQPFEAKRADARYCSPRCRQRAARASE